MLEVIEMFGPGEYAADETQGITRIKDLPRPKQQKTKAPPMVSHGRGICLVYLVTALEALILPRP